MWWYNSTPYAPGSGTAVCGVWGLGFKVTGKGFRNSGLGLGCRDPLAACEAGHVIERAEHRISAAKPMADADTTLSSAIAPNLPIMVPKPKAVNQKHVPSKKFDWTPM